MSLFQKRLVATTAGASLLVALAGLTLPSQASVTNPGALDKAPLVWLDASDPDADGVVGNNPADGDSITLWKDKSGNGNDATLVAGGVPATYETSISEEFNDQPRLKFSRVNDTVGSVFKVPVDGRSSVTPNLTVLAVYQSTANIPNNGVWGTDNGDWDRFFLSYHPAFGDGVNDGVAGTGPESIGIPVTDAGLITKARLSAVRYAGNVVDGVNQGVPNASAVFFDGDLVTRFTDSTQAYSAQSQIAIGSDGDNSVFQGEIAEVLIYPYALTDAEIRAISTDIHDTYEIAKTPVSITASINRVFEGTEIDELPYLTSPATDAEDWTTEPVCYAYASNDTDFASPLTGQLPRGTYLTHCEGGSSETHATSEYITGELKVVSRYRLARTTVYFAPYSSELTPAAKRALRTLAAKATEAEVAEVTVKGFVRRTPDTSNDISLSTARARSVAKYLRKQGISVEFNTEGLGVAPHNGPTARKAIAWLKLENVLGK